MQRLVGFCLFFLLFSGVHSLNAQTNVEQFEAHYFIENGDTLPFRLLKPEKMKRGKKYPVLLFLHGSGERGNNNIAQLKFISDLLTKPEIRKEYPCFVILPQCPKGEVWCSYKRGFEDPITPKAPKPLAMAISLLKKQIEELPQVNKKKIVVSGLSLGGGGTFEACIREPALFAAAAPICGWTQVDKAPYYGQTPMWIFHGDADKAVPIRYSIRADSALMSIGAKPKFTIYKGVGHDSWNNAFAEPYYLKWLFSKKLKLKKRKYTTYP